MPEETADQTPHSLIQRLLPTGAFTTKQKAGGALVLLGLIAVVVMFSGSAGKPPAATPTARQTAATAPAAAPLARIQESSAGIKDDAARIRQAHAELLATQQASALAAQTQAEDDARAQAAVKDAAAQRAAFQAQYTGGQYLGGQAAPVQTVAQTHVSPIGRIGFEEKTKEPQQQTAADDEPESNRPATPDETKTTKKVRAPLDFDVNLPQLWLPEGTVIETVLTNRLAGENNGQVNTMATTPVYAPGTYTLLIPRGARFMGEAASVNAFGQQRLAVTFHRILVEKGAKVYSIPLDKTPGLDQEGATALHDQVNSHYPLIFGASLAIGAIGGLANIGSGYGGNGSYSSLSQFRGGISQGMSQSSERVLDKFLNRMPTITIREGTRVKIMLTADVSVPIF